MFESSQNLNFVMKFFEITNKYFDFTSKDKYVISDSYFKN